ncbi:response regulator [Anabaena cylindrica FACHB-243]|nr:MULTISPECIES: ATP-binding protein [Anabaena]MBD2420088.1 response regulator [Anabaena cylindrica FACHB-243]MBY5282941.1 response regulator [Anabaena sp. CCAP 1446/1C]MBY5306560.1 response regulator [Anabaena sp. CCAP 1446/1C]MCM2407015.1 ATP-binding protein [Anabaena sp. CCAP 1446/1C]
MLMLHYPLYDFLATVPSCPETSTLAVVLEILEKEQCDRLVVVNQQQCPIGLLYSASLIPKLLAAASGETFLNLQQPISTLNSSLISPIQTIPASERLEKFSLVLPCQQNQKNRNLDWVLIDAEGKFLGLLDSPRLLRFLAKEKAVIVAGIPATQTKNHPGAKTRRYKQNQHQSRRQNPLVQLLERLPWPLMLQTSNGEVVTQNPAWWQQLGVFKDLEGIRQEVETILAPIHVKKPEKSQEYVNQKAMKVYPNNGRGGDNAEPNILMKRHLRSEGMNSTDSSSTLPIMQEPEISANSTSSRCFLDTQLGTCTCVVEVQNGQERIWQFTKIPLDSPELKVLSADSEVTLRSENSEIRHNELWLVLATDVTEQQQLFKELAAKNADLIQLNRLKDEFLACISHELKTPLTAVLGLSRLLVDQQLGELNERQARYASLIHQSGRHLMSVVNDILDLTRMETGQMELNPSPVQIREVCDRALSEIKTHHNQPSKVIPSSASESQNSPDHQFSLTIEPGLEQIVADELRLRQMLVHLLSNAFKFTETSGEIGLRVNRWEGWIAFTVWDTGIGIPEHQQHLIFQKFQQLENPLTRQFEGTGLGLVLTRALARLHGGDVSFLSREGNGSQFTLLLPPCPPKTTFAESEGGNSESHQPTSSQRLVLVVEAVARYIEDLTQHLKGLGYRVVIARSGTEALEKARRLQPITIFLNPLLPLLSGWDVLTLLKSDSATRHIPVIVTATGAEKEQAFAHRADNFLSLPVEHQALVPILEKLCAAPEVEQIGLENPEIATTKTPLRILRLVNPELESVNPQPSLREHRVIEVDDLDQAELLARVWQFDVILLDVESSTAQNYLQQLTNHPRLAAIPLVTCDVATTLTASKIPGLSVFPYLTPLGKESASPKTKPDALLSVLQIASAIGCPPNILVVDVTMLRDLPQVRGKPFKGYQGEKNSALKDNKQSTESGSATISLKNEYSHNDSSMNTERGSEWFQALIQYLQTAGLKAVMGNCWAEVLQQLRHQSVDLLLICLGESAIHKEIQKALTTLSDLPFNLPPILVLDKTLNQVTYPEIATQKNNGYQSRENYEVSELEQLPGNIATQILPRSISMEDLLNQINQALVKGNR